MAAGPGQRAGGAGRPRRRARPPAALHPRAAAAAGAPGAPAGARRPPLHQRLHPGMGAAAHLFQSSFCASPGPGRKDAGSTGEQYMNRKGDKSLIVGLDIGTSKVVALVGEYSPGNPIEVIGIGSHESRGLKRGVVVDIESTVQSIQRAVEEAELMAGCEIRSVYASISGNHVQCKNSPGIVPIREG